MEYNKISPKDRENSILQLEAIRAGIPSRITTSNIPDLRHELVSRIDEDLEVLREKGSVKGRLIWGQYGQGKTHFLKLMEKHILSQGYAVSYYTLNKDLCLDNLGALYPALTAHLITNDSVLPGILNKLMENLPIEKYQALDFLERTLTHPLPVQILRALLRHNTDDDMLLYNTLMGKKENIAKAKQIIRSQISKETYERMPKFTQKDHLIAFMEFMPYLLRLLGYKGWVILIDEMEIIGKLGKKGRYNAYNILSWFLNWCDEQELPLYTLVAAAQSLQDDVFFGARKCDSRTMIDYAIQNNRPDIADSLGKFFAMAVNQKQNLILKPITDAQLLPLLEKLMMIHQQAVEWKYPVPEDFVQKTMQMASPTGKPLRQSVRKIIEIMDIYATFGHYPEGFAETLMNDLNYDSELPESHCEDEDNDDGTGLIEMPIDKMFDL